MKSRSSHSVTLFELFGAPGAGKTTLSNALAAEFEVRTRHQLGAVWRKEPLFTRIAHIARAFARGDCVSGAVSLALRCRLGRKSRSHLLRVLTKTEWLASRREVILLDQGFLQDLWSILYASQCKDTPTVLPPLIRSIYRGIKPTIIFIDVDAQTAASRIGERTYGRSRLDGLSHEDRQQALGRAAQLPLQIINAAETAGLEVVRLDGSMSVDDLAKQLHPIIRQRAPRSV